MDWYNILSIILGALGGAGVSLYTAKSNKDTIDISNFQRLIEEEREERRILKEEYREYKETVDKKVEKVKTDFNRLQSDNKKMITSIFQAYKCNLPDKIQDCPVVKFIVRNGYSVINGVDIVDGIEQD
jgi:uncharacterized membrane protein (DUF106 family)